MLQMRPCEEYSTPKPIFGTPSRGVNEAISRLQGICRLTFAARAATAECSARDGDSAAAGTSDRRQHGKRADKSGIGSIGSSRLSSPRRAQYLLLGPG